MGVDIERRIRDRAYAIWMEQGCQHGQDGDHWLQAEQAIAAEDAALAVPAVKAKASRRAVKADAVTPGGVVTAEAPVVEAPVKARKPRARKTVPA